MSDTLLKRSQESQYYAMDFSLQPVITKGDVLNSVVSVTFDIEPNPAVSGGPVLTLDVTATNLGIDATKRLAQFKVSGGTSGVRYRIAVVVTTAAGNTLEGIGYLQIDDFA